jgi:hypothetical protein
MQHQNSGMDPMSDEFPLHVLALGMQDRPGAVHSVAEVFSGRGLQMEAFNGTAGSLDPQGLAKALILFHASEERADLVLRVLRRLPIVRCADLLRADDSRLIQTVMIETDSFDIAKVPSDVKFIHLNERVIVAAGSPSTVQAWLSSDCPPECIGPIRIEFMDLPSNGVLPRY